MHMKLVCKQQNNENIVDIWIFSIYFGSLIVKIYVSFLFWKKKWQGFDIKYTSKKAPPSIKRRT